MCNALPPTTRGGGEILWTEGQGGTTSGPPVNTQCRNQNGGGSTQDTPNAWKNTWRGEMLLPSLVGAALRSPDGKC